MPVLTMAPSERTSPPWAPVLEHRAAGQSQGIPMSTSTQWRIPPWAWAIVATAILAETGSNALRAYGLGVHLGQYAVTLHGHRLPLGAVALVLAVAAAALAQSRAAWVALTPGRPVIQRLIAAPVAVMLVAISMMAMTGHGLEATRAKGGSETGSTNTYASTLAALKAAEADLARVATARSTTEVRADMDRTKVKPSIWEATRQCTDADLLKGPVNAAACKAILDLRQEMARSIQKSEVAPRVESLRAELATLTPPAGAASMIETELATWWAYLLGIGVVTIATLGPVIFANPVPVLTLPSAAPRALEVAATTDDDALPSTGGGKAYTMEEARVDLQTLLRAGQQPPSQQWLADRWGRTKGAVSKWLGHWEESGDMPGVRQAIGRCKTIALETA